MGLEEFSRETGSAIRQPGSSLIARGPGQNDSLGNRKWVLVIRGNFAARRVAGAERASVRKALWALFSRRAVLSPSSAVDGERKGRLVAVTANAKDQLDTHTVPNPS